MWRFCLLHKARCLLTLLVACSIATKISYQCAIGFSGVVFGLIVVDNSLTGATQRSIFGLFYVPAPLYPWTLLVIWQLIMPGVSFLGHLCGVLVSHSCCHIAAVHVAICLSLAGQHLPVIGWRTFACHWLEDFCLSLAGDRSWAT